jgi:hypothetical protein
MITKHPQQGLEAADRDLVNTNMCLNHPPESAYAVGWLEVDEEEP